MQPNDCVAPTRFRPVGYAELRGATLALAQHYLSQSLSFGGFTFRKR